MLLRLVASRYPAMLPGLLLIFGLVSPLPAHAEPRDVVSAILGLHAEIPAEARTADILGRERDGSGILIDDSGLVLTIGYLIVEASSVDLYGADGRRVPADIVAYDQESGFGLVRAREKLGLKSVPLGSTADLRLGEPLLVISRTGQLDGRQVQLADRREFAGYWEYLLPEALFTTPAHPQFGGAALIDRQGHLVAVGSLGVGDATAPGVASPGNMFVPVDALKPILADLLTSGQRSGPAHPWLGITTSEHAGHLIITNVTPDGPAAAAGVEVGDMVLGVGDEPVTSLAQFYRGIWGSGDAGVRVPLKLARGPQMLDLGVVSADRHKWLKLKQSY